MKQPYAVSLQGPLGERDAAKDGQAVFPAAAHRAGGSTDLGLGGLN